ncbi:hypothetical protein V8G54_000095 (mitochondrion) [Vigna mungo]|uniref:Uncharacterized protein n=1 Tax=Vigna mungo TaxID=3915 RepID=A0AAQ3PDX5_VIGMU
MGGGGVMRTAAKIAGIGVSKSGLHGFPVALPTEQSVRNASPPLSGAKAAEVVPVHTAASWDEWDFADDGGLVVPRVVFGSAPTFEEAKEATTDLKDAIDQVYFSPDSSSYSSPGCEVSALSPTLYDTISNPSAPENAIRAFHLLSSSREVQAAVASLACDPNVWNAVMKNPTVRLLQAQLTVAEFGAEETEEVEKLSSCASEVVETPEKMEASSESHSRNVFSNISDQIFSSSDSEKRRWTDGNTKTSFFDDIYALGGILVGLVTLLMMVIVTKRA